MKHHNLVIDNFVIKYTMFKGQEHLIVPVVLLTEGVHHGSSGVKYYPPDEVSKFPESWNGIPITVPHPMAEDGTPISANAPDVIESQSVGRLWNVRYSAPKLKGDVWVNIAEAQNISPETLDIIRSGKRLEVSTGLYSDDDWTPGSWNGEAYDAVVRNIRPDHLALLPGGVGACSWDDGCGVRTNERTAEEEALIAEYGKKMTTYGWVSSYEKEDTPHWLIDTAPSPLAIELLMDLKRKNIEIANILEIGIGNGRDSIYFGQNGNFVFGIDVSPKAIQAAQQRIVTMNDNVQFAVGNAEQLEFSDNSFDAVYSIAALHSTPLRFTLREINRVLRVGGIAKLFLYTKTRIGQGNWISYWTAGEIKQYAQEEGFEIQKFRETGDSKSIQIPGIEGDVEQETNIAITTIKKKEISVINKNKGGEDVKVNIKSTARTPKYSGVESISWASVKKTFEAYRDGFYKHGGSKPSADKIPSRIQDAPADMKAWIASKTLLGDSGASDDRDLIFFPVVNPDTDKLNEGALRAVLGGRSAQANIPEAAKKSAQDKARSLLKSKFKMNAQDSGIFDKVRGLLNKVTSLFDSNDASHADIRQMIQKDIDKLDNPSTTPPTYHFVKSVYDNHFVFGKEGPDGEQLYKQSYFVDDSGKLQLSQEVKEVRKDVQYVELSANTNKEDKKMEGNEKCCPEKVQALISNEATRFSDDDKEWLEALSADRLDKLEPEVKKEKQTTNKKEGGDVSTNDDGKKPEEGKATFEEVLANASPEHREMIEDGVRLLKQKKSTLVNSLLANKRNKFTEDKLKGMSIEDLEGLATLAQVEVDYSGKGGAQSPSTNKIEPLEMPTMNWGKN